MPKVVDQEERREEIVRAVMNVIERDGLAQVTLANVAAEAGLAIGSVRHYTGTYRDLLTITMRAVADSISRRLLDRAAPYRDPDPQVRDLARRREATEEILAELLPLDARRRTETVVWFAFSEAARTDPELAREAEQHAAGTRGLIGQVLGAAARSAGAHWDVEVETYRLAALLDGLAFSAVQRPQDADLALTVLRRHLTSLLPTP
ncbi:MAG: TetR family transcriptional regulator [Nonomuraea sp.]|nr:TetR family transcriptional regulator [Nonomuraea sp.]